MNIASECYWIQLDSTVAFIKKRGAKHIPLRAVEESLGSGR